MVTIEQVELLESKVSKAIDYVKRLAAENERLKQTSTRLVSENDMLRGKLDGYQKRIADLEVALQGFKRDQERIEQGIVSALERLNHFEDAVGETSAGEGASNGMVADGEAEGEELESSGDRPSPASAVPPPVAAPSAAADAGIPAGSTFAGPSSSEPCVKEAGDAGGAFGENDSDLLESPEPEAADDDMFEADASDETFGEMSGGTEMDADEDEGFREDDETDGDEFLDALKNDRPSGLGQIAAAFHENASPPSENLLEKPAGGLELDIF